MKKVILTLAVATYLFSGCKKEGCTDMAASNYNEKAKKDDGSCEYLPVYGTVTDIDGNIYKTVKIGNQEWMAENLKVTHYQNGDAIPTLTDGQDWNDAGNNNIGAYCIYENNETNADVYGYLYNWYAATDGRNIAPEGWHVPTKAEYEQLETFLDDDNIDNDGVKLKEEGTVHWQTNEGTEGTNTTGFTALPGGERVNFTGAAFDNLGKYGYWWTTTSSTCFELLYQTSTIGFGSGTPTRGNSIRCVKD